VNIYLNRMFFSNDHPRLFGLSIYFQGCDRNPKCQYCHNQQTWKPYIGYEYELSELIAQVISKLDYAFESYNQLSLCYVGGEPLAPYNRDAVLEISRAVKLRFADRIVNTLFSWRMPDDIIDEGLLDYVEYIDEFVLGPYDYTKRNEIDGQLMFPASTNQIYLREGLKKCKYNSVISQSLMSYWKCWNIVMGQRC